MFYRININNGERANMINEFRHENNKHPKVHFEQYLYNSSEPLDDISSDTPPELKAELLENSFIQKRRFRRIAQRMRNRHS